MALAGLKVIEFGGLAPGPFAGLILADNGADVIRIDRPGAATSYDFLCRGKRSIVVDSKKPVGRELLKRMVATADVVIDPFRPGVMERLGLGPEVFLGGEGKKGLNERLVYARIVGFPRTGPHKDMAGHDLNTVALSGVLSMIPGADNKPGIPLTLLGDFAGGGAICAMGILLALLARGTSGKGQVVDTDMVTGLRYIASSTLITVTGIPGTPVIGGPPRTNLIDGGAPFYNVYTCKDGGFMTVGCLEPHFYQIFLHLFLESVPKGFALEDGWRPGAESHHKRAEWGKLKEFLERGFLTQTREWWTGVYHGTEACVVPVLTPQEAARAAGETIHPRAHPVVRNTSGKQRNTQVKVSTSLNLQPGLHTDEILGELGLDKQVRRKLWEDGVLGDGKPAPIPALLRDAKL